MLCKDHAACHPWSALAKNVYPVWGPHHSRSFQPHLEFATWSYERISFLRRPHVTLRGALMILIKRRTMARLELCVLPKGFSLPLKQSWQEVLHLSLQAVAALWSANPVGYVLSSPLHRDVFIGTNLRIKGWIGAQPQGLYDSCICFSGWTVSFPFIRVDDL